MTEFHIEHVNLSRERNVHEIKRFLERFDLNFDTDVDFTVAVRDGEGTLVGTGSSRGEVLRNIAVDENIQGAGLTSSILSALIQNLSRKNVLHYFIFTRPEKAFLFVNLGFAEIARAEPYASLLESGLGSVAAYCESIAGETARLPQKRAAVVMNANPFTKGHRALVEQAAAEYPGVVVFVVSEDKSLFPFADRMRLIKEGVSDLANVAVVPGGKYIISAATFPTYFTRERDRVKAQTRLDIALFASQIAPKLGIAARYIGEEPYCPVTAEYNEAMIEILVPAGVSVHVAPRIPVNHEMVSASKVREAIRIDDWKTVEMMVPPTTFVYLRSEEKKDILENIRSSNSRH